MPTSCMPVRPSDILFVHALVADIEKNGFMIWRGIAGGAHGVSALFGQTIPLNQLKHIPGRILSAYAALSSPAYHRAGSVSVLFPASQEQGYPHPVEA